MTSWSEGDSDEEFIFTMVNSQKQPTVTVQIEGIPVSLIVDSGSSVNLINNNTFKQLQSINPSIKLVPSKAKIFPYGTTPIQTKGQFNITICYKLLLLSMLQSLHNKVYSAVKLLQNLVC